MSLRISYKHAFGEVVQYGVERCFAFAQCLLRPLTLCGVSENDGEPSAVLAAHTRGVDVEPLVQRLGVALEAHVLARIRDPAEGLEPVRFGIRVELERGLALSVREARHPPERWVRLQDTIVHRPALSVV